MFGFLSGLKRRISAFGSYPPYAIATRLTALRYRDPPYGLSSIGLIANIKRPNGNSVVDRGAQYKNLTLGVDNSQAIKSC